MAWKTDSVLSGRGRLFVGRRAGVWAGFRRGGGGLSGDGRCRIDNRRAAWKKCGSGKGEDRGGDFGFHGFARLSEDHIFGFL